MSMLTELWGIEATSWTLEQVKAAIRAMPPIWSERKSYILKDYANIKGIKLEHKDFTDVGALPQTK